MRPVGFALRFMSPATLAPLLARMVLIRTFEESVLDLFARGELFGTTHTGIGQEAVAVGVLSQITRDDVVSSNHRCHGHYLALFDDPAGLMAELMGRSTGLCGGIGGSQHLQRENFYTNGIQGGIVPGAAGMALAEKFKKSGRIAVVFLGDGTLGEGVVYETLNLASLWQLPVLFVVEANGVAQSTPTALQLAGSPAARASAFGIRTAEGDGNDLAAVITLATDAVTYVRRESKPCWLVLNTHRLGPHSKGDDHRPAAELALARTRDPVALLRPALPAPAFAALAAEARARVDAAIAAARSAPFPTPQNRVTSAPAIPLIVPPPPSVPTAAAGRCAHVLNRALHGLFASHPDVVMLGEDLLDPYGGAFKVSAGLSTEFPGRVLTTPISEAAIVGMAGGLALRGLRPIVEIMFGDFTALAADQIINHLAKFRGIYAEKVSCPVVIRTPMGARRGYGPTHSQSLEKIFLGIPGLTVVAPSRYHELGELLRRAVLSSGDPVLFIENKAMYAEPHEPPVAGRIAEFATRTGAGLYPTLTFSLNEFAPPDLTVATYGGMTPHVLQAALTLALEHELFIEVVVPSCLSPLPTAELLASLATSRRLLTAEEGTLTAGWGAEVVARLMDTAEFPFASARVAAADSIIPTSRPLEDAMLPQSSDLVAAALRLARSPRR